MPQSTFTFFFFNDTATTEIYTLSLHDALPICGETPVVPQRLQGREARMQAEVPVQVDHVVLRYGDTRTLPVVQGVAVRHDHVESVHGAALEEADENWAVRRIDG